MKRYSAMLTYTEKDGFEETAEGKYLRKIFPHYFNMTQRAEEKVNKIMERYGWWVRLHKEYIAEMKMRVIR